METQPQNPEFRINPENFHPCFMPKVHIKQLFESKIVIFFLSVIYLFLLFDSKHLSQQFFSYVGTGLPGLNQY